MKRLLTSLLLAAAVAGCAETTTLVKPPIEDTDLVAASYVMADNLLDRVPWLKESRQPVLTASFVNINQLDQSSALGRIVAEQVGSCFSQKGYTIIEMKMRNDIFIREGMGEFVLSRQVRDISEAHNAAALIAGTYAIGKTDVYVSARLIRASDSLVLASYDFALPLGPNAKTLLASQ